jgi:hypothetical protein
MLRPIMQMTIRQYSLGFLLASLSALALASVNGFLAESTQAQATPLTLKIEVAKYGVLTDELQAKLGMTCKKDAESAIRIAEIRPGGEAASKWLRVGDIIVNAWQDKQLTHIVISRGGKMYEARLWSPNYTLKPLPLPPLADVAYPQPFNLKVKQSRVQASAATGVQMLSNYDLEFLIDRSLSMRRPDCPGGQSRWDWCGNQAANLAEALSPYVQNGLTVTRFATDFDVHEHATANDVADILSQHDFQFGTRLYEPLAYRLDSFFARHRPGGKPLLIAIITDGCPYPRPEPYLVRQELINASQQMTDAGEVTVVFLQIGGDDPRGRRYLYNLGNNLQFQGARYQFVHTTTFEELETVGLAQALVNVVTSSNYFR